jgi:class 3 adenylate cyclase
VCLSSARVLIVDDIATNRDVLAWRLQKQGLQVEQAADGREALGRLEAEPFDMVFLDVMMPGLSGYQVLEQIKSNPLTRDIPVLMISAVDEIESVVRCIELGAEDYLPKPFQPVILRARVAACLEKKRMRDQEQVYLKSLKTERDRSDRLLLNILPRRIADLLKDGQSIIADSFAAVTILFADLVGFTEMSTRLSPSELVEMLNGVFSGFDELADRHGLEKIKTIGDSYLVAGGVPTARPDHAFAVADMGLDMLRSMGRFNARRGTSLSLRIGINSGPVVAGVIGVRKFSFDLWGDAVNTASRMESHGVPDRIQVTEATWRLLRDHFELEERGTIPVKGKGLMRTFYLVGRKPEAGDERSVSP